MYDLKYCLSQTFFFSLFNLKLKKNTDIYLLHFIPSFSSQWEPKPTYIILHFIITTAQDLSAFARVLWVQFNMYVLHRDFI